MPVVLGLGKRVGVAMEWLNPGLLVHSQNSEMKPSLWNHYKFKKTSFPNLYIRVKIKANIFNVAQPLAGLEVNLQVVSKDDLFKKYFI